MAKRKEVYPILKVGNFYFPIKDKNKKFKVKSTYNIKIPAKKMDSILEVYKKRILILHFNSIADIMWKYVKKQIKQKGDWLCPQTMHKLGKEYVCSIDVLEEEK